MDVLWVLGPDAVLRFKFKLETDARRAPVTGRVGVRLSDFEDESETRRLVDVGRVVPDGRRVGRGRDMVDRAQPESANAVMNMEDACSNFKNSSAR